MKSPDVAKVLLELWEADAGKYFDDPAGVPMTDPPVVAVAAADDPWFARFKEIIGPFYWTPGEALSLVVPGATARSVISWSLPNAEVARRANRAETRLPARRWAYIRTFGEELMNRMRSGLVARLGDMGCAAAAPHVLPQNKVADRPKVGWSACWSERHTAFVAGLGTFGLSGGLITRRGIAHRLASVVTDAAIDPTPRPYGDDPFAWCLRTSRGSCGACIRRCPAGSIGETHQGRDKEACRRYAYEHISTLGPERFGWKGVYGCGLCQAAVPCEDRNPTEPEPDDRGVSPPPGGPKSH